MDDIDDVFNKDRDALVKDLEVLRKKYCEVLGDDSTILGMLCYATCLSYILMDTEMADRVIDHARKESKKIHSANKKETANDKAN